MQPLDPLPEKWESFGFSTAEVNGHDIEDLGRVLGGVPFTPDRPSAVICHTVKGKGISFAEGEADWHHKSSLQDDVIQAMYEELA